MSSNPLSFVISSAVGALAALTGVALWEPRNDPTGAEATTTATARAEATPNAPGREVEVRYDDARLQRLEGELALLARQGEPTSETEEGSPPLDPKAERIHIEEFFAQLDERYERDIDDPAWSPEATGHLHEGLGALGSASNFSLVEAECRSAMCRATLRWDSYTTALEGAPLHEQRLPGLNCSTSAWLPEPASAEDPYTAEVYLDCSEQRAGEVEPTPLASAMEGQ